MNSLSPAGFLLAGAALARDTTLLEAEYFGTAAAIFAPFNIMSSILGDEADPYITIFAGSSSTIYINDNQTANQSTNATVGVTVNG